MRLNSEGAKSPAVARHSSKNTLTLVNLDFDARVPVPFSVFPSTYRSDTSVNEEVKIKVDSQVPSQGGREDTVDSRYSYTATGPSGDSFVEKTRIYEDIRGSGRTSARHEDIRVDFRENRGRQSSSQLDLDLQVERDRYQKPFRRYAEAQLNTKEKFDSRDSNIEIDIDERRSRRGTDRTIQREKVIIKEDHSSQHPIRQGLHNVADRILHPFRDNIREELDININMNSGSINSAGAYNGGASRSSSRSSDPFTITIPCHHVRIGDLLLLQGRICQVIKISTSNQTGQYRYLGVDLFNKQLYEEASFQSSLSPNVFVQNMLGPVFKQYRILDIGNDGTVVAITEAGDIKQSLPILDQGGLLDKLSSAFDQGQGSVRVLVINDNGRELAVDMKVQRGANL